MASSAVFAPRDQPGQSIALANDRFGATSRTTRSPTAGS
jgi:hypothetical protein